MRGWPSWALKRRRKEGCSTVTTSISYTTPMTGERLDGLPAGQGRYIVQWADHDGGRHAVLFTPAVLRRPIVCRRAHLDGGASVPFYSAGRHKLAALLRQIAGIES